MRAKERRRMFAKEAAEEVRSRYLERLQRISVLRSPHADQETSSTLHYKG